MRKKVIVASLCCLSLAGGFYLKNQPTKREAYESYLRNHDFHENKSPEQVDQMAKTDRPDLAWEQDFLMTMNPEEGRPTPEKLTEVMETYFPNKSNNGSVPGDNLSPWIELGPTNVGGRVRALVYDQNDPKGNKVWAGGTTGGMWYNNDITNPDSSWHNVNDFWDNIAISCMAIDPSNPDIMYAGTGEGWRMSSSGAPGGGIWKTTDGGTKWKHIDGTEDFIFINDLIVRKEGSKGVLYVASDYSGQRWVVKPAVKVAGLYRSEDGGTSFSRVFNSRVADLEIAADNRLWVGTYYNNGAIFYSDDGKDFDESARYNGERRVELACAPSNSDFIYALFEKDNKCESVKVSKDGGDTWTDLAEPNDAENNIPDDDFTRGQAWYNLILAVDPTDENTVLIGGIDLFKSTNAGSSWTQMTHWYGGFGFPNVHADQHAIVFKETFNGSEVIFGNDGGIYYSSDINKSSPTFSHRVKNFNTTQFYACAIHPDENEAYFIAGSQDNGSQRFRSLSLTQTDRVTGGDGSFCHIDQLDPSTQITSYVYNRYYLSTNDGVSFPKMHWDSDATGWFINPTDYDDSRKILYAAYSEDKVLRLLNANTHNPNDEFIEHDFGAKASMIKVSPFTKSSTTLFIGTAAGRFFSVKNANKTSNTVTELTDGDFPTGAISSLAFGATEADLIVTFYNYGVSSIFYSDDGGSSWSKKEGDLPDMPVRSCLVNPTDVNNVIIATEVGVWSTSNFNDASPSWSPSNNGLANVRVDMLKMRTSDLTILAATHGRGLFTSQGFIFSPPQLNKNPEDLSLCPGSSASFKVAAGGATPFTYEWYHDGVLMTGAANNATLDLSDIEPSDSGEYYCNVINRDGQVLSDTAYLTIFDQPQPDLGNDYFIIPKATIILSPGKFDTYIWSQGPPDSTLTIKGKDLGLGTHEIRCTVYNKELCSNTDTIQITVDEDASIQGRSGAMLSVYPTRALDYIQVDCKETVKNVAIFNLKGQELMNTPNEKVDVSSLDKGVYLIRVKTDNTYYTRRFEKI